MPSATLTVSWALPNGLRRGLSGFRVAANRLRGALNELRGAQTCQKQILKPWQVWTGFLPVWGPSQSKWGTPMKSNISNLKFKMWLKYIYFRPITYVMLEDMTNMQLLSPTCWIGNPVLQVWSQSAPVVNMLCMLLMWVYHLMYGSSESACASPVRQYSIMPLIDNTWQLRLQRIWLNTLELGVS